MSAPPESDASLVLFFDLDPAAAAAAAFSPPEREALDAIDRRAGAEPTLPRLLDFVAMRLRGVSPCDRFSLAFVEDGGRRVRSRHTRAYYEPVVLGDGYTEPLASTSLQSVIDRGSPRIIRDLPTYLERHPRSRSTRALVSEGVRSNLTCPLRVDGRTVGVLFRSSRRPDAYDERQVLLHVATATRLAQAVEKVYQIELLEEANRAYHEMLGFVSHELRAPLASMLSDANLLAEGYLGALAPPQRERIERMTRKGKHLMSLMHDYLELARLESGVLRCDARGGVDVAAQVIEPAIDVVQTSVELGGMSLVRDWPAQLAPAELDPQLMRVVLVNLLSNAVKYGVQGGEIRIRARRPADRLDLAVWNEGMGFALEDRAKLFRRFSRLSSPAVARQVGSGVGLYTAARIAELHGGRIVADAAPGAWAEFRVSIPQPLSAALSEAETS